MAASNATPKDRIRIFDREGHAVAEFRTRIQRSWAIGKEGRAAFDYASRKSNVVNEQVLQFGNWLLVESDTLPPWVGVLDTPRSWSARRVSIHAYSPEHVFGWRIGPLEAILDGAPGVIFERILNYVNAAEMTIISAGSIWRGSSSIQETINPTQLNKDLLRVQERSKEEYQWRPLMDPNGKLIVYADWMEQLGRDTNVLLHEGKQGGNIEATDNIMTEDGPIINYTFGYGDGETWKTKPSFVVMNNISMGRYGMRQESNGYSGVSNAQTLQQNGTARINARYIPLRTFRLNALNVGDTFRYIRLGNRLTLRFQNMGFTRGTTSFETTVRILAMAYDPEDRNKISLVVQEKL